jgi:colanic acid biosynthesis glycosyl transferase WcaI
MTILLLTNYYYPESVGAAIWVSELACDLAKKGHRITVITSYPSYPTGRIFGEYRNRFASREDLGGIECIRTFTSPTSSKSFMPRLISLGTFCLSSVPGYLRWRRPADLVYAILPPLPLGVSAWVIAVASGARLVVNVQDIYPDIAVALGYLRNRIAIRLSFAMERWIYRRADKVVVISDGFRENLLAKGVPDSKIRVVPNWTDPDAIRPGKRFNAFRSETGAGAGHLLVIYAGGLGHNAELDTVLDAAAELRGEPVRFAVVGDGVRKEQLQGRAKELGLENVKFFPFQPLERYPEVLAAADVTLVTLNSAATYASVPSKIYKQMAAARPIIAVTDPRSELRRLIEAANCGGWVVPGDSRGLAALLRQAAAQREAWDQMGWNGREYVERYHSRRVCVAQIESVLEEACG